jgi:hypothetical protein
VLTNSERFIDSFSSQVKKMDWVPAERSKVGQPECNNHVNRSLGCNWSG